MMNSKVWISALLILTLSLFMGACEDEKDDTWVDDNYDAASLKNGGQLYDKWWKVNNITEPTTDFNPIWASQSTNTRSGSTTWRCKECHGWDYVGKNGRYSSGSHYTGFEGVWDSRQKNKTDIFDALKDEDGDHDLSGVLTDDNVLDLTKFIIDGLVNMSLYIDSEGSATGDATDGQTLYENNCAVCHGADGKTYDFDDDEGVQGVYWLSNDNPQETLHKIRWGHPGSQMPSMVVDKALTDDETGDILAYAQTMHYANINWVNADIKRGGQLYDKWWKVNDSTEPTTDFDPIWASQSTNTRSGSTTWRCKECHGWDYIGKDGRYSSGSHYTGFEGVWDSRENDRTAIFDAIKEEGGDHDLNSVLDDVDLLDLTKFIVDGLVDMSLYINSEGSATGDATNGQTLYENNCAVCHGADGKTIDFDGDEGVQGIGWLSNDNPQETLHKIRWGHPGSQMPSMIADAGLTDDEAGDILAYAQTLATLLNSFISSFTPNMK